MPTARVTSFGFVVSDSGGTYDPPWAELPAGPFQLGKRWTGRSILTRPNGQKVWVEIETQVVAREKVTVPLGTFDTYKVDVRILSEDGREQRMSFWYDPAWGYAVKKAYQSNRPGAAPEAYIREVVRRTRNE